MRPLDERVDDPSQEPVDWAPLLFSTKRYLQNIYEALYTLPRAHRVYFNKRNACSSGLELQSAMYDLSTMFGLNPDFNRVQPRLPGPQWYDFICETSSDEDDDDDEDDISDNQINDNDENDENDDNDESDNDERIPHPRPAGPRLTNRQYYEKAIQDIENSIKFYQHPKRSELFCYRCAKGGTVSKAFSTKRDLAKHCWETFAENWRNSVILFSVYRA
jgi:hypothetical protein